MAGDRYEQLVGTTDRVIRESVDSYNGPGDAGRLVALASDGYLPVSLMPVNVQAIKTSVVAGENLAAGDWVNIYDDSGTRKARKATSLIYSAGWLSLKQAHGFVIDAVNSGNSVDVYIGGINSSAKLESGNFTASDRGRPVFLSNSVSGRCVLIAPDSYTSGVAHIGNTIFQNLGIVLDYNSGDGTGIVQHIPLDYREMHTVYDDGESVATNTTITKTEIKVRPEFTREYIVSACCEIRFSGILSSTSFTFETQTNGGGYTVIGNLIPQTSYSIFSFQRRFSLTGGTIYDWRWRLSSSANNSTAYMRRAMIQVRRFE